MNIRLLDQLKAAAGAFVPFSMLGPDPVEVDRELQELVSFGFGIARDPIQGASYLAPARRLCQDQITWNLGTKRVGRRVQVFDRVRSTNDIAALAAVSVAHDGLVVLAEEQLCGRGSRGRTWSAPSGSSILLSNLLFPEGSLVDSLWLTALGAVSTAEVVEAATGQAARIKWPNDVRVEGRKIAGVLVERGQGVVIGIGLNVYLGPDDFPRDLEGRATSLRMLSKRNCDWDRSELARQLIQKLDFHYEQVQTGDFESFDDCWRTRLEALGQNVLLETHSNLTRSGRLLDASLWRGLLLAQPDGTSFQVDCAKVQSLACSNVETSRIDRTSERT